MHNPSILDRWSRLVLQAAAKFPPALKSSLFRRSATFLRNRLSRHLPSKLTTNLGISSSYRITYELPADSFYLFGRPEQLAGETGALFLCRFLMNRCSAFVDIGCHRGYFVFFVRGGSATGKPIYFFEPHPKLFAEIQENVAANQLKEVYGFPVAVGSAIGKVAFFLDETSDLMSSLNPEHLHVHSTKKTEIDCTSFDEFARSRNLTNLCVKVDIENAEHQFLGGATQESARISFLIIEVLGPAHKNGFVNELSKKLGLVAYYINGFRLEHSPDGTFRYVPPEYNWLFCRLNPTELSELMRSSPFTVC